MARNFVEVRTRISKDGSSIIINMDGYSTFKTLPAVMHDVAKEVRKYDPSLANDLADVKTVADARYYLLPMGQHDSYIFEVEEVPCASLWNEETEEMTYADGANYFHILFCINNPEYKEEAEDQIEADDAADQEEEGKDKTVHGYTVKAVKVSKYGDTVALIDRNFRGFCCQPFVVAWNYDKDSDTWGQGHYFTEYADALQYFNSNY